MRRGATSVITSLFRIVRGKPFPADRFALKFPKAGEYSYTCSIHPGMAGVVAVK